MTNDQFEKLQYFKKNNENFANPSAQLILSLYEDIDGGNKWGRCMNVDNCNEIPMYVNACLHPATIKIVGEWFSTVH